MRDVIRMVLAAVVAAGCLSGEAAAKKPVKGKAPVKRAVKAAPQGKLSARKTVRKSVLPSVNSAAAVETAFRRTPYVGAIAANARTGEVVFRDRADVLARPASVTKLMTALLVLEDIAAGKYGLETQVSAGPMALRQEPSIIGFQDPATKQPLTRSVDTLLYALMIRSANDAAVALAEHANGSLDAFVARMNTRARALGMAKTEYYNPNGLPPNAGKRYPWKKFNVTTCEDQLKLAREIILKHPEITKYTSQKTWVMPDGLKIINHNNVMRMDKYKIVNPDGTEAIDGLKTGYIDAGGSSVVLTGKRGGERAIVVVLGSQTARLRDENARKLMLDVLDAMPSGSAAKAAAAVPDTTEVAAVPADETVPKAESVETAAVEEPKPETVTEVKEETVKPEEGDSGDKTSSGGSAFAGFAVICAVVVAAVFGGYLWGKTR